MSKSVKLDAALVDDARGAAALHSRSLAGQIAHWARIGRAVERSGSFDHARLSRVLAGEAETTALTPEEKAVWSERFLARMEESGSKEEAAFAALRASGVAVGLDAEGRVVVAGAEDEASPGA